MIVLSRRKSYKEKCRNVSAVFCCPGQKITKKQTVACLYKSGLIVISQRAYHPHTHKELHCFRNDSVFSNNSVFFSSNDSVFVMTVCFLVEKVSRES